MKHEYPLKVEFEDVDLGGVVHHPNYLRFCERGRVAWLEELEHSYQILVEQNLATVVRAIRSDYHRPCRFRDQMLVTTELRSLRNATMTLHQAVVDPQTKKAHFEMEIDLVCLDTQTWRPVRLPQSFVETISVGKS